MVSTNLDKRAVILLTTHSAAPRLFSMSAPNRKVHYVKRKAKQVQKYNSEKTENWHKGLTLNKFATNNGAFHRASKPTLQK